MTEMRPYVVLALFISAVWSEEKSQENVIDIICPLPGNPSPSLVTEDECAPYTACEYSEGICHMKKNNEAGYIVKSSPVPTEKGFYVSLEKAEKKNSLFNQDIQNLRFEAIYHEDHHLQLKIYDPVNERFEIPIPLNVPKKDVKDPMYAVNVSEVGKPFVMTVTRKSNGNTIMNSGGPLTFEDQFIQIITKISSDYLYGLGETGHSKLRHDFKTRREYPIFARDQAIYPADVNFYGSHPYYVNVEDDEGNTHSVLFYNSNAMEFSTFLMHDGSPTVNIRTIGGIIDFHIFMGPTPEAVNQQYASLVGLPNFPPYWALGFQLSRWGYNSVENYLKVHDRMKAAAIPWDTQVFDIDYMYNGRDFTFDAEKFGDLPSLIHQLHDEKMKVILMVDSAIAMDWESYGPVIRGRDADVFIQWMAPELVPVNQPEGARDYVVGRVWPDKNTIWPDFMKPATLDWWKNELKMFHQETQYDGIWIDMNEPSNFDTNRGDIPKFKEDPYVNLHCPQNYLDDPPYETLAASLSESGRLSEKTICMASMQTNNEHTFTHYDVHNLYGYSESVATHKALTESVFPAKRPMILTRSSFVGSGKFVAHWTGDNFANWDQLRMSLIGMMEFNMFAMPMVGADICGFIDESDEELCIRWMQAGAFYPFDRNHNSKDYSDQDPARPGWDRAPIISKDVLTLRYKYIPFMYTKLYQAHAFGSSVIRPLFNVFPSDLYARDVNDQFFWAEDIMIAPVVTKGTVARTVYFPQGLWYDIVSGNLEEVGQATHLVHAPLNKIPVYVRGGSILPYQEPSLTTTESRKNPFGLTVALNETQSAFGDIFWDDGEDIDVSKGLVGTITFSENYLTYEVSGNSTAAEGLNIETIEFYGFPSKPQGACLNGKPSSSLSLSYDESTRCLTVKTSLPLDKSMSILFNCRL